MFYCFLFGQIVTEKEGRKKKQEEMGSLFVGDTPNNRKYDVNESYEANFEVK